VPSLKLSTIGSFALSVAASAWDLERAVKQCRFSIIRRLVPAPTENFSVLAILLLSSIIFSGPCRLDYVGNYKKITD